MSSGKMDKSEVGKLGWKSSRGKRENYYKGLKECYNKNPKRCDFCDRALEYEKRRNKFCNHSCAMKCINRGVRRHGKNPGNCLHCGKRLLKSSRKFCNNICQQDFQHQEFIKRWMEGSETGMVSNGLSVSSHIKRWLYEQYGNVCCICKGTEWMGEPIPLTVDHADGDYRNNNHENLRLVCGNCGMLLPTFTGRNRGNGRMERRRWDNRLLEEFKN